MKGVGNNPALDAYQRMITPVRRTGTLSADPAAESTTVAPGQAARADEAAKVSISGQARELAEAKAEAAQVDTAKVDALKAAIQARTFNIDPTVVAERLLDELG